MGERGILTIDFLWVFEIPDAAAVSEAAGVNFSMSASQRPRAGMKRLVTQMPHISDF